jgi:hypothetical protein
LDQPLVLKMAATDPPDQVYYLYNDSDSDSDDADSLASIETEDGADHPPEKILAQLDSKNGFVWYLVKWQDCPLLRSSWEVSAIFESRPKLLDDWLVEKRKQEEGKSKPLDIAAFNKAVLDVEVAERQRRILRRLKRRVNRVLSIVAD